MQKLIRITVIGLVLPVLFFSSCIPLKDYVYLQGDIENVDIIEPEAYRIQANDNLYIQVISNDELSMYFNLSSTDRYLNNDAAIEMSSYKVSSEGEIDFPFLGPVKVVGLTTKEIKQIIGESISEKLVEYSVVVKLVNRSVSLLGEFNTPGTFSFYKDRMTIFEAIGMGHDISDFGNRKKVKIIRQKHENREVTTVDLTSKDIFQSEYYYILPNDVIYVEPTNKIYGGKTLPIGTIISAASTLFNIYYIIDRTLIPSAE